MIARSRGLKPADDMPVSPCVAGNQDADNLHGHDLHDQGRLGAAKAIRAGPLARIRSASRQMASGAVEHVQAGWRPQVSSPRLLAAARFVFRESRMLSRVEARTPSRAGRCL